MFTDDRVSHLKDDEKRILSIVKTLVQKYLDNQKQPAVCQPSLPTHQHTTAYAQPEMCYAFAAAQQPAPPMHNPNNLASYQGLQTYSGRGSDLGALWPAQPAPNVASLPSVNPRLFSLPSAPAPAYPPLHRGDTQSEELGLTLRRGGSAPSQSASQRFSFNPVPREWADTPPPPPSPHHVLPHNNQQSTTRLPHPHLGGANSGPSHLGYLPATSLLPQPSQLPNFAGSGSAPAPLSAPQWRPAGGNAASFHSLPQQRSQALSTQFPPAPQSHAPFSHHTAGGSAPAGAQSPVDFSRLLTAWEMSQPSAPPQSADPLPNSYPLSHPAGGASASAGAQSPVDFNHLLYKTWGTPQSSDPHQSANPLPSSYPLSHPAGGASASASRPPSRDSFEQYVDRLDEERSAAATPDEALNSPVHTPSDPTLFGLNAYAREDSSPPILLLPNGLPCGSPPAEPHAQRRRTGPSLNDLFQPNR